MASSSFNAVVSRAVGLMLILSTLVCGVRGQSTGLCGQQNGLCGRQTGWWGEGGRQTTQFMVVILRERKGRWPPTIIAMSVAQ